MMDFAIELTEQVKHYEPLLRSTPEENYARKPSPSKWSKKEILGHLVDSAQNNIRRLILGQYEERPKIVYQQDEWVSLADYQSYETMALIDLWVSLNLHLAHLMRSLPTRDVGRLVDTGELHTLDWIATDYLRHLLHHLHQVFDLDPVAYP